MGYKHICISSGSSLLLSDDSVQKNSLCTIIDFRPGFCVIVDSFTGLNSTEFGDLSGGFLGSPTLLCQWSFDFGDFLGNSVVILLEISIWD